MCVQSIFFYFVPFPPKTKLVLHGIKKDLSIVSLTPCKAGLILGGQRTIS